MTMAEIEERFADEWVLAADPVVDEMLQVQSGRVLWHGKDRDEVYRKALELNPHSAAFLYTEHIPYDRAVIVTPRVFGSEAQRRVES